MVEITDYCGIKQGKREEKSTLFEVFYGELKNTPLIKAAPINMGCRLMETVDLEGTHYIFIGEIIDAHAEDTCLTNGKQDIQRFKPIAYSTTDMKY
ncbi:MAG: hypothetical protein GF311_19375 [Candidatus Lokiarchaeota archaeon]|nr:hypothetical protein [Candidatus Lokiarchaeota archaeon]